MNLLFFDSLTNSFYQQSLNHEQRYGSEFLVLITGKSNRIGLEYYKQLAQMKLNITLISLNKEGLERV